MGIPRTNKKNMRRMLQNKMVVSVNLKKIVKSLCAILLFNKTTWFV